MTATSCTLVDSARLRTGLTVVSKYRGRGIPASAIATGFPQKSLLENDIDPSDPPGTEYRVEWTKPTVGSAKLYEDSSIEVTGLPDGTQTGAETVYKNGAVAYGTTYSLVVGQASAPADSTAPTAPAAAVANATPTVVTLTASEALNGAFVPPASAFAVAGHTVSAVAVSGTTISLAVTPAFINGEATRAVSYTQPATGGARDVAGNLLASFTGRTIANNVAPVTQADTTVPTITAAVVENATPATVTLTASEALNGSFVPLASAFIVAGHTVSAAAVSGDTISLTVSPAFAYGEGARVVAYVQPATGGARDAAGNLLASFTGRAITSNVAAPTPPENPGFTRSRVRTIKIKAAPLTFEGSAFWDMRDPKKPIGSIDKDATIDVSFDWTEVLADIADALAGIQFDIDGLTSLGGYFTGGIATIFVKEPTGQPRITCRITTSSTPSRVEDRSVFLKIEDE